MNNFIIGIVCVDSNWGIGKDNKLLFSLPIDMEAFRMNTKNSIVVCGEKTLLSFPNSQPLKDRTNIVLCREGHKYDNCICVYSTDELINMVKCLVVTQSVYIIGGAFIYNLFLPYFDTVRVTKVDANGEADRFFPNLDEMNEFEISYKTSNVVVDNGYDTNVIIYVRKTNKNEEH